VDVREGGNRTKAAVTPDTREQAIRRTWGSAPRKVNEWTPMTVSVGEGDARRSNDMLVIQRKARSDGQADSVLTMRVLRMGKLLASDPAEPLVFTFKLTGENKVEQVGRARVPTADDIAQWEGAGFAVPGKKAEAPKPVEPPAAAPAPDPDAQDRQGLREEDRRARALAGAAEELTSQIQGDIAENDFAADEVMPGLRLFAEQAKLPADELREEVLKRIRKSGMKRGDIKRVERALDPTKAPAPAPAPEPYLSTRTDTPAAAPAPQGGFDPEAWDKARADRITASREAGNVHLDTLEPYVETMRGKAIRSVHDPKVKGTIFTVDNNRNVYVDWVDAYSQEKEGAVPMQYGRRKFMQSTLGPRDLKDYVLDEAKAPAPAPTNPPAPVQQTRPEELIELRKRASVLKQLLECLG
jgi:hypothetical protein